MRVVVRVCGWLSVCVVGVCVSLVRVVCVVCVCVVCVVRVCLIVCVLRVCVCVWFERDVYMLFVHLCVMVYMWVVD